METQASDGARRDSRRYQLALRLMAHQARTGTISAMTSLSRHQQEALRARWGVTEDTRRRGPAPSSLARFTHSPRARSEGAVLAGFCRTYGLLPLGGPGIPRRKLLTMEVGERLCDTYESYRGCFPWSKFEIEELLSFAIGIAANEAIGLGRCDSCSGTVIIDRLAPHRAACAHCQGLHAHSGTIHE
ncbi:MAG: hypothetical protein ACREFT_18090 [Acetobacteraceae bacterium]